MEARAGETGADGFIIGDSLMSIRGIKDDERKRENSGHESMNR